MSIIAAASVLFVRSLTPRQRSAKPHHATRRRSYLDSAAESRARQRL
jgi:hypothetical protein